MRLNFLAIWGIRSTYKEVPEVLTRPPSGRSVPEYEGYPVDITAQTYNRSQMTQAPWRGTRTHYAPLLVGTGPDAWLCVNRKEIARHRWRRPVYSGLAGVRTESLSPLHTAPRLPNMGGFPSSRITQEQGRCYAYPEGTVLRAMCLWLDLHLQAS